MSCLKVIGIFILIIVLIIVSWFIFKEVQYRRRLALITKQTEENYQKYLEIERNKSRDKFIYRDSLFVVNFMDQSLSNRKKYKDEWRKTTFDVGDIFYSPDSLKIFVFGVVKYIRKETDTFFSYDGIVYIGFRNARNNVWKIHESEHIVFWGSDELEKLLFRMRARFFSELIRKFPVVLYNNKNENYDGLYRTKSGGGRSVLLHYCLPDPRFWDDALFIKDNELEGSYDFEVKRKNDKFYNNTQDWFVIPDSIKAMYKTE